MALSIFQKKSITNLLTEADESEKGLKRTLGARSLVALGIGAIIGAGLFSITGGAAANQAGPAITLSFVVAALGCAFAGLCYAEFASMIPVAGSAYTYSYATMGEMIAWIIGWDLVLEYAVGAATVGISWSRYLVKFLEYYNLHLPPELIMSPFDTATLADGTIVSGIVNLPAVFIIVLMSLLLIKGTQESALVNGIIVALKVTVVLIFIFLGWKYINSANYTPYIPDNTGNFGEYGFSGIIRAAAIVFFAYIGFDAVSTQAGEAINPKKDVPFAIVASLIICTILYILVSLVLTGMVKYDQLDKAAPVASAFSGIGINWAVFIITIAAVAGLTSVMLVMMLGQTRIFLGMAKDGLLPKGVFGTLHPTFKTPYRSTILVGGIISIVAALTPIDKVSEMCSMGTLLAFAMVCVAVMILRVKKPELERPYKTPAVFVVGTLGVLFNLFLMTQVRLATWKFFIVWGLLGIIVYFVYSKKHSNLNKE